VRQSHARRDSQFAVSERGMLRRRARWRRIVRLTIRHGSCESSCAGLACRTSARRTSAYHTCVSRAAPCAYCANCCRLTPCTGHSRAVQAPPRTPLQHALQPQPWAALYFCVSHGPRRFYRVRIARGVMRSATWSLTPLAQAVAGFAQRARWRLDRGR
jgi:hypothetical protein